MKVLLSIKPEYANKIFSGEKGLNLEKSVWKHKRSNCGSLFHYASR